MMRKEDDPLSDSNRPSSQDKGRQTPEGVNQDEDWQTKDLGSGGIFKP